jgi:hypothetical protein
MPATSVSIRLGVEGKTDVKRAFDDVGKAGQDAFRGVATSMDAAGAAADRQTQRLQRLAQAAKQAAAADQAQNSFNQVLGIESGPPKSARDSAEVFASAAKASEDLEARTAALRAQIDPLGEAERRMNAEVAEADALFKAGTITQKEHGEAVALAKPFSTSSTRRSLPSRIYGEFRRCASSTELVSGAPASSNTFTTGRPRSGATQSSACSSQQTASSRFAMLWALSTKIIFPPPFGDSYTA